MMFTWNLTTALPSYKAITDAVGNVSGKIGNATGSFVKSASETVGNVSGKIGNATSGIIPTTITEKKSEEVVQKVTASYNDLSKTVGEIGSKGPMILKSATDNVTSAFKGVTDTIGNVSGSIGNWTGKYGKYIPIAAAAVGGLVLLSVLKK